jgi:hypothetical protein
LPGDQTVGRGTVRIRARAELDAPAVARRKFCQQKINRLRRGLAAVQAGEVKTKVRQRRTGRTLRVFHFGHDFFMMAVEVKQLNGFVGRRSGAGAS